MISKGRDLHIKSKTRYGDYTGCPTGSDISGVNGDGQILIS